MCVATTNTLFTKSQSQASCATLGTLSPPIIICPLCLSTPDSHDEDRPAILPPFIFFARPIMRRGREGEGTKPDFLARAPSPISSETKLVPLQ